MNAFTSIFWTQEEDDPERAQAAGVAYAATMSMATVSDGESANEENTEGNGNSAEGGVEATGPDVENGDGATNN